jgi:hypothetical protein
MITRVKDSGASGLFSVKGLAVLLIWFIPLLLFGQSDSGRVVGNVIDLSGAVVAGAHVTLTSTDNGAQLTTTTDASGEFGFPMVPRGNYKAAATAAGYAQEIQSFTLNVTQIQTLRFSLKPGSVSTSIDVTDDVPLLDTSDASVGATIQGGQITELPLNGRNFTSLALLSPGVTRGAYGDNASGVGGGTETYRYNDSGGAALSINGLRPQANNFILDGIDNNEGLVNTILFFPPVDATQEFKLITSVAPAEYGRGGGAIVVSSLKSGTNHYHGSAFDFYRSAGFDANPNYRFEGAAETKNPSFTRQQFGGSAGGRILKDKLFAFGDYQGWRENQPINAYYETVPSAKMRTGDFSELLDPSYTYNQYLTTFPVCTGTNHPASSLGQIYDPMTCAPFSGNIIPSTRMNKAATNYLNAFPAPTVSDSVLNNYLVSNQQVSLNHNSFDTRWDWDASRKDNAFFRVSYDNSTSLKTNGFNFLPGLGGGDYTHTRGYDLGETHTINKNILNEARLGYNRITYAYTPAAYGVDVCTQLGIVNCNHGNDPLYSGGALIGGSGSELSYTGDYGTYTVPQNSYEFTDTLSAVRGKHTLTTGGTMIRRQVSYFTAVAPKGFFYISYLGMDFTGWETSELLAGAVDTYYIGAQNGFYGEISQEDGFFAQDDWRVTPRLTLNLGLRYDLLTWPYEMHNRMSSFDMNTGTVQLAGQGGAPRTIVHQDYGNFAPRVGFAYSLTGNGDTVVRGGYGMFYFVDAGGIGYQLDYQVPYQATGSYSASLGYCITLSGMTATQGSPYNCAVNTDSSAVTTPLPVPSMSGFDPQHPPAGLSMNGVNQNNAHPRVQEWNLQVSRQIGKKDALNIAYVGSHSGNLATYYPYNNYEIGAGTKPFPNFGSLNYIDYNGIANYSGLQIHEEHRDGNLMTTGSYAWSHTLDDSPGAFTGSTLELYYDRPANYGNSNQDQRQVFSWSTVYKLPFGHGQRIGNHWSRPMELGLSGWQLNLIALLQSGTPVDLSTSVANPSDRPDLVGSISYPKSISGNWFNPNSFSGNIPTMTGYDGKQVYTRVGTLGRNQVFGPSSRIVNFSAQKDLHFTDSLNLELHADAFNLFNTPQFTNPGNSINSPQTFGKITGVQQFTNRQLQLAARVVF